MDCSPQGSSVHGISQARILEWVNIPSSGGLPYLGIKPVSFAKQADFKHWATSEAHCQKSWPLNSRASLVAQLVKNPPVSGRPGFDPWVRKIPRRRERLPTPVFWPGGFCGLYSPRGRKESDWETSTFTFISSNSNALSLSLSDS